MFLKKLELNGFKSFATKTVLDFEHPEKDRDPGARGVTAIVGPNGSGKSNVADAVRWVMGEQSMKNLRGKKSEDIIFAGSGKKARLGSAKAVLYLDNSDKKIPLDFSEVSVARKIYRSGESEYLVNGSRVRLQDVVDILAKAGVGKESNAIVNQGMADAVLNATASERRMMIEEAAGVKHYQIKKERSLRKLESTKNNLKRAKELAEEIRPHLKTLKRQAEKASQSETVSLQLKDKQQKLFSFLWHSFRSDKERFAGEKEDLGIKMMNIQREVDKMTDEISRESKEESQNDRLAELEKAEREARSRLSQLERELIITGGRIEIEKEKQRNSKIIEEIRIKSVAVDFSYVKKNLEEIRRDQEKLVERISSVEKMEDLQDVKEFARVVWQKIHDLRSDIEKGKKEEKPSPEEIKALEEAKKRAEEEATAKSKAVLDLKEKAEKLREEIKKTEEEILAKKEEVQREIVADRKKRQRFFDLERELRKKQEELSKMKDLWNEAKISLAKVEVREEDLRSEIKEELRVEPEDLPSPETGIDAPAFERDIIKLKVQMEQIGGIDPMVIAEYDETRKRYDFLVRESEDLEKAISSLKEIVKEMDQKIEVSFSKAFEEINKEFTKYFRIIFGGGNAHLTKLKIKNRRIKSENENENGDDVSDSEKEDGMEEEKEMKEEIGIEIFACPPGKKISNLSMLSGGERSLTSLALLFAIISHNPPPFSILDEVEAALDEANSKRFGRIITELSSRTQFIIITHNRETMRQASLLYGVTMGEDGISKLLSVRLDQVGQGGKILR